MIRLARLRDVRRLARDLRTIDRLECEACGHSPETALRLGMAGSDETWTFVSGSRPVAMFGIVVVDLLTGEGRPWLLASDRATHERRAWLEAGRGIVARWLNTYQVLAVEVAQANIASRAWLRRLGFEEGEAVQIGGVPFVRVRRVR